MKPSIKKLQKFFTLEAERDYDNKAVMGGLINVLDPWETSAREDEIPEELIQLVRSRLKDYQRLNEKSRRDILKGLWERIRKQFARDDQEATPLPQVKEEKVSKPKKEEATDAKLDALEKQVDELIVLKAQQDAKVAQDRERLEKAKAFLVDSIIEKTNGGYTQDALQKRNVCYLQALDSFIDQGLKAAIESQSGRIPGYPVVKDSEVKPVEFEKPYVGKRSTDGKSYERI